MTRSQSTLVGFVAVLLWALLALFTVGTAPLPPLQLNAMCFAIGALVGLVWSLRRKELAVFASVPWWVYAFGTAGLFGYHFLYFSSLRSAPPAQAGLIAYLWPLLIVVFSGLLPGESLRAGHILGAVTSFLGVAIILGGGNAGFDGNYTLGYALAFGCAVVWSGYSVLSRQLGTVPTACVTIFCLATAILSLGAHLAFEETVVPVSSQQWASVVALGLGPVGAAFYFWDLGVKKGDIQLLGVASYAAPLLSTLILVITGVASPSWGLGIAAVLIAGGALLAARASAASTVARSQGVRPKKGG